VLTLELTIWPAPNLLSGEIGYQDWEIGHVGKQD
jgi:hypothetical protein